MNTGNETPRYEELLKRLREAEATLKALQRGEIDSLVGEFGPIVLKDKGLLEEQARLKAQAEEMAKRWQAIFDATKDAIFVLGTDSRIENANKAAEEIFGSPRTEMIGLKCCEVVHNSPKPIPGCPLLRLKKSLKLESMEMTHNGRWYEVTVEPIFDQGKRLSGVIHLTRDITDRRKREQELIESEEKYRDLVENLTDLLCTHDLEGRFLTVNRAVIDTLGIPKEELVGMSVKDILAPDVKESFHGYLEEIEKKGASSGLMKVLKRSGEIRILEYRATLRRKGVREPIVRGVVRDITEQWNAEKALKESESKFRSVFEASNVGKSITSLDGIISPNRAFCEMLGYTPEELKDKSWRDLTPEEDIKEVEDILEGLLKGKSESARFQKRYIHKDGHHVWADVAVALARDKNRRPLYFIVTVIDITEQKNMEKERESLQEQLFQAQKLESVGRLAAGVAHDFNNMLGIIMGYGELLLQDLRGDKEKCDKVLKMKDAASRSANLVKQLLAFSRKQRLEPKVIDLKVLLKDLSKMLGRLIGEDIKLVLNIEEDIHNVFVDPVQMEQVIVNIVVNARDAMPDGGTLILETKDVVLDARYSNTHKGVRPGNYVLLSISDTGCGMDKEILPRIFDPFFTTKEKGKGTGLGLSTVYGIVKQSGGNIWVYSEVGKGSTFKIYLPQAGPDRGDESSIIDEKLHIGAGERILVVEDDPMLRDVCTEILASAGYEVSTAENGREAISLLEINGLRPRLLITDIVMPEMNGKELADRLKEVVPGLKVLFMSGYTEEIIVSQGVLTERENFIQKPFSYLSLLSKVGELLEGDA